MKTKIFLILLLIPLVFGVNSCKKSFLEPVPVTATPAAEAFTDQAKVEAVITGLYDRQTHPYYIPSWLISMDLRGYDLFLTPSGNYGRFVEHYNYNIPTTYYMAQYFFEWPYKVIATANQALEIMPESTNFTEEFKQETLAEFRALRAFSYFNMVLIYAHPYSHNPTVDLAVPLVTTPVAPTDDFPARASVSDIYNLIVEDLEWAAANFSASRNNIQRITLNAINGLLARVHLHMGNWAEARDYAIAARDGHPLSSTESLTEGFVDATSEWIFSQDNSADDNNGFLTLPSFYDCRTLGYSSIRATYGFVSLFESTDVRSNQFEGESAGGMKITKYLHKQDHQCDQVLMRSAEMYLIEAECEAQLEHYEEALTALHAIQLRANATLTPEGTTGQDLLDAIYLERRKELFAEGFHLQDMMRRGEGLTRTAPDHYALINLGAYAEEFLFPIPQAEMDANSNMSQNLAYK